MIQYVVDYLYDIEKALDLLKYIESGEELRILELMSIKHIDNDKFDQTIQVSASNMQPIAIQCDQVNSCALKTREIIDAIAFGYEYYFTDITVGRYTFSEALRNRERLFREFGCANYQNFVSKTKILLPLLININKDSVYDVKVLVDHHAARIVPIDSEDLESVYAAKYLEGVREAFSLTNRLTSEHDRAEITKKYVFAKSSDIPKHVSYTSGFQAMLKHSLEPLNQLL